MPYYIVRKMCNSQLKFRDFFIFQHCFEYSFFQEKTHLYMFIQINRQLREVNLIYLQNSEHLLTADWMDLQMPFDWNRLQK